MKSRERVVNAINHQHTDKVPVDFGGTVVSGISASMVYKLRRAFKLHEHPVKVIEPYQMLGEIEDDLREKLCADCAFVLPYTSLFGFRLDNWKPWTLFDGTPVLVPGLFNTDAEASGGICQYPEGDKNAAPSGFMPKDGKYFDTIIRQDPSFDDENPSVEDNLEEFSVVSDEMLRHFQTETEKLRRNTNSAIVVATPGTGLGDIAHVPAPFLKNPKGIRDVEEWYISLASRKEFIRNFMTSRLRLP